MKKPYQISNRIKSIMLAISYAIVEEPSDITISNRDESLIERCTNILREFPKLFRRAFVLGIFFFDCMPFFFGFGCCRFLNLENVMQQRMVDRCMRSRFAFVRNIIAGLRGLIMVCYFSHSDVWDYIGYDPKAHVEERKALRKKLMADS